MAKNSVYIDIGQGLSMMVGLPTITIWNNNTRPKNARRGTIGFNVETQSLEYWSGAYWFVAPMYVYQQNN